MIHVDTWNLPASESEGVKKRFGSVYATCEVCVEEAGA
jgi:hypothetical protein